MAQVTANLTVNFQGTITGLSIMGFGILLLTPEKNTATIGYQEGQVYTASVTSSESLYAVTGTGCTISNIQEKKFDVVFTSENPVITVEAWVMTTVIGYYTLNMQNLTQLGKDGETYDFSINYRSDGTSYAGFTFVNSSTWMLRYTGIEQPLVAYSSDTGWTNQHYRAIAFGDTEQEIPRILKNWLESNGTPAMYSVAYTGSNVSVSVTGGTAHAQGETVTFTATPGFGYAVRSVTATASGQSIQVYDLGENKYSFTMPGSNVTLTVTTGAEETVDVTCTMTMGGESAVLVGMYVPSTQKKYTFWELGELTQGITCNVGEVLNCTLALPGGMGLKTVNAVAGCTISNVNTADNTFDITFTAYEASLSVITGKNVYSIARAPVNASISAPGTATAGATVQFTVTATSGYSINSVLVRRADDNETVATTSLGNGRYSFTMPYSDAIIVAAAALSSTNCTVTFDEGATGISTDAGSGGTWNVSGTAVNISGISKSERYTFNVTLTEGYTLTDVKGTGCTILSKAESSFVVGFSSPTSRISVVTEKEGVESYPITWNYSNATLTGAVSSAEAESVVSFSILPENGYEVTGVTARTETGPVTVNVSGSTYSFTMPAASVTVTVLTALAPRTSDLTVNFDSGVGYVSADINGDEVSFSETGSAQAVTYVPGEENSFTAALVDGYRISYVNGENCTISDINYAEGTFSVVFTGTPSTVNIGTQALEPETVEVSLAVMFDDGVSAVSTNVDGTTVSWTTSGSRQTFETQDGATRDFSISLVSGYYLESVSGTGCTVTARTENGFSVLFTSATPNISIVTQRAAQISYPISYSYTSGTLNGPSSAEEGDLVTFTFTPENGYTVGNVTVMGNTSIEVESSGNTYSFYMPAEPVTVSIAVNTPDIITIQTLGVFKEEADEAYAPSDVVYAPATLTDEQQAQARENIGAVSEAELSQALEPYALQNGTYSELSAGHATEADRSTGDEKGNRIISFYGHDLTLSINPQTYVMTITLESEDGTVLATRSIDLPLESMVVSGTYDEATKEVVLTLQNGQQIRFSVADLVDGLASQAALDAETQARKDADAALAQSISYLQDGSTPAGSASKLTTDNVGSAEKPVYFENGVPVACGDSLSVNITGTAGKAVSDEDGNNIEETYTTKQDLAQTNGNVSALQEELNAAETSLQNAQEDIQNLYTIASQTVYLSQDITQEYTSRVTADGAEIINGALAELKEIRGRTVSCKNLVTFTSFEAGTEGVAHNGLSLTFEGGIFHLFGTFSQTEQYTQWSFVPGFRILSGTTYTSVIDKPAIVGISIVQSGTVSNISISKGLRYKSGSPAANSLVRTIGFTTSQFTEGQEVDFTFRLWVVEGAYTDETAPEYQPYFSGLKNANFKSLTSTGSADDTEDVVSVTSPIELAEYDTAYPAENKVVRQSATITQDTPFTEEQLAQYSEYVLSQDGMTLTYKTDAPTAETIAFSKYRYKAYNGGTEAVSQGATDNSEYGAELTLTQNYAEKRGGTQ